MDTETFSVLRQAVRMAKAEGWRINRDAENRHSVVPVRPDSASYGDKWFHPYLRERISNEYGGADLYSIELTEAERDVFRCNSYEHYAHLDGSSIELTRYEVEASDCQRCDERVHDDNLRSVYCDPGSRMRSYDEQLWCESCADNYAFAFHDALYDADVGVYVHGLEETVPLRHAYDNYCQHDDGEWYEYPPDEESEEDSSDDLDDDGTIYRYGTNVLSMFGWPGNNSPEQLVFGVELEVEPKSCDNDGARVIAVALGGRNGAMGSTRKAFILAADGSLENKGIEIITVPQTLEQHHTGAVIPWREISKALANSNAMSGSGTENCGMHVHINRKALSQLTVGKMMVLVNSPRMRSLIELIAQRPEQRFCVRKPKKVSDVLTATEDHYDALNVGTDHGTLELRIFKGNTRHSRIMKNIEFAHALCLYCRDASMQAVESPEAFRAWIMQRASTYPNLSKFLSERSEDTEETRRCA